MIPERIFPSTRLVVLFHENNNIIVAVVVGNFNSSYTFFIEGTSLQDRSKLQFRQKIILLWQRRDCISRLSRSVSSWKQQWPYSGTPTLGFREPKSHAHRPCFFVVVTRSDQRSRMPRAAQFIHNIYNFITLDGCRCVCFTCPFILLHMPTHSASNAYSFCFSTCPLILLHMPTYSASHACTLAEASFRGGGLGGRRPKEKEKKKKRKKKREKREKKRKRKKGTMNDVKLLHIKCRFFQFFNSPVALKKNLAPQEKVEMTPLHIRSASHAHSFCFTCMQTHSASHAHSFCFTCPLILLHVPTHSASHAHSFCFTCPLILLHMPTHSASHAHSFCFTCPLIPHHRNC